MSVSPACVLFSIPRLLLGGTDIPEGIEEARRLLNAQDGTAAFMIVITDGNGGDPTEQANMARDEGTIVFAVGVGTNYFIRTESSFDLVVGGGGGDGGRVC